MPGVRGSKWPAVLAVVSILVAIGVAVVSEQTVSRDRADDAVSSHIQRCENATNAMQNSIQDLSGVFADKTTAVNRAHVGNLVMPQVQEVDDADSTLHFDCGGLPGFSGNFLVFSDNAVVLAGGLVETFGQADSYAFLDRSYLPAERNFLNELTKGT